VRAITALITLIMGLVLSRLLSAAGLLRAWLTLSILRLLLRRLLPPLGLLASGRRLLPRRLDLRTRRLGGLRLRPGRRRTT